MSQTELPPPRGNQPDAPPPSPAATVAEPAVVGATAPRPTVPTTRTGVVYWALGVGMLLLIVVIVFVLQNLTAAKTRFFNMQWTIPLGLDLLLAALLGGLIVFLLGAARMLQLRRLARRYARPESRR
jgi:uncharacterized integral membrane protein